MKKMLGDAAHSILASNVGPISYPPSFDLSKDNRSDWKARAGGLPLLPTFYFDTFQELIQSRHLTYSWVIPAMSHLQLIDKFLWMYQPNLAGQGMLQNNIVLLPM